MGDDTASPKQTALQKARESRRVALEGLEAIPCELQVRDADHARSPEVIQFALNHLAQGGTYEVLRKKLGLGPAHRDHRWRLVREVVNEGLIPTSESDALRQQADGRQYLVSKVEDMIEDFEGLMSSLSDEKVGDRIMLSQFMKFKLEALKLLMEENAKSFEAWATLQKIKVADRKTQGPSIIIQNNYHIPRPGDKAREVIETTAKVSALIAEANKVVEK